MIKRCLDCKGSGFIIKEDPETGERKGFPCHCRLVRDEQNRLHVKLISADIPNEYWDYTFENYLSLPVGNSLTQKANKDKLDLFKTLLDDPGKFMQEYKVLWIWGPHQNACHTSLAVMLATELLKKNFKVKFITMQRLADAFINFDDKKEYFKNLENADVLVIDDAFDSTRCSISGEYTRIHLFNWLRDILTANKRLICTSKVKVDQIDVAFAQSKGLLQKYAKELELQGSLRTDTHKLV
jgi:DNA replication protein DnaC